MKIVTFVLALTLLGCSRAPHTVVPPRLATHAARPSALTALHRIQISPWQVSPDLRGIEGQLSGLNQLLRQSATSELGLEVAGAGEKGGRAAKTDGTLHAELIDFRERAGSALAADSPARVGFRLVLSSLAGEEIWQASYHLDDAALSDNLFRIKESIQRGPRWRTATEILTAGLQDAFRSLEEQRTEQFTGGHAR